MTSTKTAPSRSKKKLLMFAGTCGILEVIVIIISVSLAISYSPEFSLTQNRVSDLTGMGYTYFENVSRPVVSSPVTEILARSGFIIGGIVAIVFSIGLFYDDDTPSHRLGAVFVLLGVGAFCAEGIFPETSGLIHFVAGYILFLLVPIGILLIGGAFSDASHKWLGYLSIALGVITCRYFDGKLRAVCCRDAHYIRGSCLGCDIQRQNVVACLTSDVKLTSSRKRLNDQLVRV